MLLRRQLFEGRSRRDIGAIAAFNSCSLFRVKIEVNDNSVLTQCTFLSKLFWSFRRSSHTFPHRTSECCSHRRHRSGTSVKTILNFRYSYNTELDTKDGMDLDGV